jgi:predicted permease
MTKRLEVVHARVYRALLRAYPGWFREAHGEEMEQLFWWRLGRVRGMRGIVRLWYRMAADTWSTSLALRGSGGSGRRTSGHAGGDVWTFWQDVRYSVRQLLRTPVFAAGAVGLLAVGIGANIAVFTLVDGLLLRPPPYEQPDEVVYVYQDSDDGEPSSSSYPATRDMARSPVFSAVAATSASEAAWERADGPVEATIEYTTASYLEVTGLPMSRGRWFSAEHDNPGSEPVAVVSAPAWRSRFGSDPAVVGSTIRLNGHAVTIIGVGPAKLSGTYAPVVTDFWLSISATMVGGPFRVTNLERREDHWYDVRARLAPGVSVERAQLAMNGLAASLAAAYPDLNRGRDITVFRAKDVRQHPQGDATLFSAGGVLTAIVVTLLLLACANLANMLLVRGLGRSSEMAVRRALGAGAGSVARLYVIESLLLSLVGGTLGIVLARWALAAMPLAPLPYPLSDALALVMDARVVTFSVALMIGTGLLFGLAPALRSTRDDIASVLRDDRRTSSLGRGTLRLRNTLVVIQVSASFVLILAAGLLGRSLAEMQRVDTGIEGERIAYVRTSFGQAGVDDAAEAAVALEALRARVASLPGVTHAAASSRLPAQRAGTTTTVVEGYTPETGTDAVELDFMIVTSQYFQTMGLPLLEGRGFAPTDVQGGERVIVINRAAAQRFWGGADPIGRRLRPQSQRDVYRVVVGVVGDAPVATLPEDPVRSMFYIPVSQSSLSAAYVTARTEGDAVALLGAMRGAVTDVRSTLPIMEQGTMASHFASALAAPRFVVRVMGVVSLLAVLLAGLGIYAVVAFNVARRSGELGIRVALGADPGRVVRTVVRETVGAVVLGLAGGIAIAALAARRLQAALFGIEPLDPLTFAGAVAFLAGVAWLAAYLPARRAAKADPVRALRAS